MEITGPGWLEVSAGGVPAGTKVLVSSEEDIDDVAVHGDAAPPSGTRRFVQLRGGVAGGGSASHWASHRANKVLQASLPCSMSTRAREPER